MAWTANIRRWHRYLALFAGIQLSLWVLSGLYFVWTDLDAIHGDPWRSPAPTVPFDAVRVAPSDIDFAAAGLAPPRAIVELDVVDVLGRPHYRVRFEGADGAPQAVLADAATGAIRGPLTEREAIAVARASFASAAEIAEVHLLTGSDVGPHHEYRGRALPAWQVRFDHESGTTVYVSAREADATVHRNRGWRIFDALWMLHTMDYAGRDDFNNPVVRTVATLACAAVVTGYLLGLRTRRRRRRAAASGAR